MSFSDTVADKIPYFVTSLTPKQIHFHDEQHPALAWILRAVLILSDGSNTAQDMARELFRTFDEIVDALFVLYWGGVVQMLVIDDVTMPISYAFVYAFAPLPFSVKLCGGASYDQRIPAANHQYAQSAGFRPYQPQPGRRPIQHAAPPSLFAA